MKLNVSTSVDSAGRRCNTRIYIGDDVPWSFQYQVISANSITKHTVIYSQNEYDAYDLYYDNTYSTQSYTTKACFVRDLYGIEVCTKKE